MRHPRIHRFGQSDFRRQADGLLRHRFPKIINIRRGVVPEKLQYFIIIRLPRTRVTRARFFPGANSAIARELSVRGKSLLLMRGKSLSTKFSLSVLRTI